MIIKKNKGFTLVELLAVIVILAVILAIAVPSISNVLSSSTRSLAETDAKMLLKAVEYKMLEDNAFDPTTINETNINTELNINDTNYERVSIKEMNDTLYVTIVGKNKWNNLTISGTKTNTKAIDTVTSFIRGANAPVLAEGMVPIKWDADQSKWVDTTTSDVNWYNYDTTTKKWANARTKDCTPPDNPGNIETCSMWVWIPRYVYKIRADGWHKNTAGTIDIQFTKGVDDNWNKASVGTIDLREGAEASKAAENGDKYTNHPAFTFGDTELTGIWVAKFEASSSTPGATNGGGDTTALKVKSIPNVTSWRGITNNNIFIVTRAMETDNTYGWGETGNNIDTHMMKNSEWGAVAYLSKSIYGANDQEIWNNAYNGYKTGCSGSGIDASNEGTCIAYNEVVDGEPNGTKASTTHNIYGIYDISGGAWEKTAAYLNNGQASVKGASIVNAENKYKDIYTMGSTDTQVDNYALTKNHKGDAIYETSSNVNSSYSWYGDYSCMPNLNALWFARGGNYEYGSSAGAFTFNNYAGEAASKSGFRPVLLVGAEL